MEYFPFVDKQCIASTIREPGECDYVTERIFFMRYPWRKEKGEPSWQMKKNVNP